MAQPEERTEEAIKAHQEGPCRKDDAGREVEVGPQQSGYGAVGDEAARRREIFVIRKKQD
jgi:hypothetical protein